MSPSDVSRGDEALLRPEAINPVSFIFPFQNTLRLSHKNCYFNQAKFLARVKALHFLSCLFYVYFFK